MTRTWTLTVAAAVPFLNLRNDLSMLVAKNRHGATGLAELAFWGHYSKALDTGINPHAALRQAA